MFGKKKKEEIKMKNKQQPTASVTTLIGENSEIEGNINSSSSAKVEGKLKGTIKVDQTLIIGENGKIVGDIYADQVIIFGKVEGKIEAGLLELKNKGILLGDILVETMVFDKGGIFNGNCQMKKSAIEGDNVTKINQKDSSNSFKTP